MRLNLTWLPLHMGPHGQDQIAQEAIPLLLDQTSLGHFLLQNRGSGMVLRLPEGSLKFRCCATFVGIQLKAESLGLGWEGGGQWGLWTFSNFSP